MTATERVERSRARARARYYAHRDEMKEANRLLRLRYYEENRALIDSMKSQPCMDCGQQYPPYVMDFDHRDPAVKRLNVSRMVTTYSPQSVRQEIEKCDVMCANCHRERTHS